jgi:hypothetical protein
LALNVLVAPWMIVPESGLWSLPIVLLACFFFFGVELIDSIVEEPFGRERDDLDQARRALLQEGWPGMERQILETRRELRSVRKRTALQKLWNYLEPHAHHLPYPTRLAQGRTIGSGLVEGGCKHIIGRRLKQTGARWRVTYINAMAAVCCAANSPQWDNYWTTAKT